MTAVDRSPQLFLFLGKRKWHRRMLRQMNAEGTRLQRTNAYSADDSRIKEILEWALVEQRLGAHTYPIRVARSLLCLDHHLQSFSAFQLYLSLVSSKRTGTICVSLILGILQPSTIYIQQSSSAATLCVFKSYSYLSTSIFNVDKVGLLGALSGI